MKRSFYYTDDKSNKFWIIDVSGNSFTVSYGKTGTTGVTQDKEFADAAICQKEADKLIAGKVKKGYVENLLGDSTDTGEPATLSDSPPSAKPAIAIDQAMLPVEIYARFESIGVFWKITLPKGELTSTIFFDHAGDYRTINHKTYSTANEAILDTSLLITDKAARGFNLAEGRMEMLDGETKELDLDLMAAIAATAPKLKKIGGIEAYDPGNMSHASTFVKAIRSGDIDRVQKLIERGVPFNENIHITKNKRCKALETAVESKNGEIVKLLLSLMEQPYFTRGKEGEYDAQSIFIYAARIDEEAVEILLDAGYPLAEDATILYWLSQVNLSELLTKRIIEGANPDHDRGYALLEAMKEGKPELAIALLDRGVTTDVSGVRNDYLEYSKPPILSALQRFPDNLRLFQKLIEKGADMSVENENHATPIDMVVAGAGSPEVREFLRKNALRTHIYKDAREEELHAIVKTGVDYGWGDRTAYNAMMVLLNAGVDSNCRDGYGCTPLHYALAKQIPCFISELLEFGADPNARDNEGRTPLFYYCRSYGGNGTIITEFVDAGADINAIDNRGRTILIHAATSIKDKHDMCGVIQTMLQLKSDTVSSDPDGNTFMHHVMIADVGSDADNIIGMAVGNGADLDAKNNAGYAPLHLVVMAPNDKRHTFHDYKTRYMLSHKADVDAQDNEGNTPLHLSVHPQDDYSDLLSGNPDLSIENNAGQSVLDSMKANDYYEKVKEEVEDLLKEAAAGGRQTVSFGWTPQMVNPNAPTPTSLNIAAAMLVVKNDADNHLVYLNEGRFGVVGNIPGAVTIIDGESGQIIWHLNKCYDGDGGAPISDANAIYVAREDCGSRYLTAHEPATGTEIWRCGLSSSYKQFGTILVQTKQHILHANISAKKVYVTDKTKGKVIARIPMANPVRQYARRDIFTWDESFFLFGIDEKKGEYVLDHYDIAAKAHVGTIASFGEAIPFAQCVYNDHAYVLAGDGCLYKIELPSGKIVNVCNHSPEVQCVFTGSKDLNIDADAKIHYILRSDCGQHQALHTYDLTTDKLEVSYSLGNLESDLTARAATSDRYIYLFGRGQHTGRDVMIYDAKENEIIAWQKLANNGGYDQQEHALVIGDAIYIIQQGGDEYGDNSVFYRIQ